MQCRQKSRLNSDRCTGLVCMLEHTQSLSREPRSGLMSLLDKVEAAGWAVHHLSGSGTGSQEQGWSGCMALGPATPATPAALLLPVGPGSQCHRCWEAV